MYLEMWSSRTWNRGIGYASKRCFGSGGKLPLAFDSVVVHVTKDTDLRRLELYGVGWWMKCLTPLED